MRVPLFIEFSGRNVLVIGGGQVGTRRAVKFLGAGARVKVLSKDFSSELRRLAAEGKVELLVGDANDLNLVVDLMKWADLVIIATPNHELNARLRALARELRRLVNDATNAEDTDVVVPFEGEVAGIRLAVTTEGLSGVVARRVLREFTEYLRGRGEILNMAKAWFIVKREIKARVSDAKLRLKIYSMLDLDEKFNELARKGLVEEVLKYVDEKVRQLLK